MNTESKIAVLEALRAEHEKRHDRVESDIATRLRSIDNRLGRGEDHFSAIDGSLNRITGILAAHCENGHNIHVAFNGKERVRQIVIKVGPPMITGGGLVAIIMWALDKMFT